MVITMADFRIVASEAVQQFQGILGVLFRNHDALHVGASNLKSRQETSEVSTMNEHGDIVGLEE
jgi:hypothetical protein